MCVAVVRVKFRTEASAQLMEMATEELLTEKIESLRGANGVVKIEIFKRDTTHRRVEIWETEAAETNV